MLGAMTGGAVSTSFRAETRRSRGTLALAIVLAALAGGAALTAAAGARRSDTAYSRFLQWAHVADFGTGGGASEEEMAADLAAIEAAPFVESVGHVTTASVQAQGVDGELYLPFQIGVIGDRDDTLAHDVYDREKVLRGRHARPDAVDEATVSF